MNKLIGLENAPNEVDALFIFRASDIRCILDNGCAATAAGSKGALNIWKDLDDFIRCEFMVYHSPRNKEKFLTIKEAEQWYKKWSKYLKKPLPNN